MAKKFGKFLLVVAAIGGAIAAVYYFAKKMGYLDLLCDDEDFEDEEDIEEELEESRTYVPLTPEEAPEDAVPFEETVDAFEEAVGTVEETVEEFFDEVTE